jgi:hypothetical protein
MNNDLTLIRNTGSDPGDEFQIIHHLLVARVLDISIADLCSEEGLKAGCQAIGAPRVGGTEEQILFVIDAYTHRRAEESLELDDLMAHRFIQLSGVQSRLHLIVEIRQREGAIAIGPAHSIG